MTLTDLATLRAFHVSIISQSTEIIKEIDQQIAKKESAPPSPTQYFFPDGEEAIEKEDVMEKLKIRSDSAFYRKLKDKEIPQGFGKGKGRLWSKREIETFISTGGKTA